MNDFARDDELKTRGNRVGPWSLVKTSALGHKRKCAAHSLMSALPPIATSKADIRQTVMSALLPKADMCSASGYVRFGPIADMTSLDHLVGAGIQSRGKSVAALRGLAAADPAICSNRSVLKPKVRWQRAHLAVRRATPPPPSPPDRPPRRARRNI